MEMFLSMKFLIWMVLHTISVVEAKALKEGLLYAIRKGFANIMVAGVTLRTRIRQKN